MLSHKPPELNLTIATMTVKLRAKSFRANAQCYTVKFIQLLIIISDIFYVKIEINLFLYYFVVAGTEYSPTKTTSLPLYDFPVVRKILILHIKKWMYSITDLSVQHCHLAQQSNKPSAGLLYGGTAGQNTMCNGKFFRSYINHYWGNALRAHMLWWIISLIFLETSFIPNSHILIELLVSSGSWLIRRCWLLCLVGFTS